METYTIAQAAEATGRTTKSIRNRVDRKQLRVVLRDGTRRIPYSELERAGLLGEAADEAAKRQQPQGGSLREAVSVAQLLDRIERQAGEIAQLRALTERAESLEQRLFEERAERQAAEARAEQTADELASEREWQKRLAQAGFRERRRLVRELRTAPAA